MVAGFRKTPYFENWPTLPVCMWTCGGLALCGRSELLTTKKASFRKSNVAWQPSSSWDTKLRTFKTSFFVFFRFMGRKGVFWVKKRCFGVFWINCEVVNLNKRKELTTMDHRNKIQSLVSPTDDPGDVPDSSSEYGHICHKSANFSKHGFCLNPSCI